MTKPNHRFKNLISQKPDQHEHYRLWKESVDLFNQITTSVEHFPTNARAGLDESLKSLTSDFTNKIAQAAKSNNLSDYQDQLKEALDSVHKSIAQLYIARQWGYVNAPYFKETYHQARELSSKLCLFGGFTHIDQDVR